MIVKDGLVLVSGLLCMWSAWIVGVVIMHMHTHTTRTRAHTDTHTHTCIFRRRICLVHNGVLGSVAKLQHLGSMWLLCLGVMAGYSVLCSLVEYH